MSDDKKKKTKGEIQKYISNWGRLPCRPRKIQSVDQMEELIDEYFLDICGYKIIGDTIIYEHPTITSLALHLGFTSRQSLLNYEGYGPEYKRVLQMAKLFIESRIEQGAMTGKLNAHHCTLNLKNNFNWKEKNELEIGNAPDRKFNINFTKYENKINVIGNKNGKVIK